MLKTRLNYSVAKRKNLSGFSAEVAKYSHSRTLRRMLNLLVLCTLVFSSKSIKAQWSSLGNGLEVYPASIWGISVPDSNTIWATTWDDINFVAYDDICKSVDGGETWEVFQVEINISQWLGSIFALDDQTAWVIAANLDSPAEGEIYKTSDGGENWVQQETAFTSENQMPTSVHFFDENEGLAFGGADIIGVSDQISIYLTSDGGDNWVEIPTADLPEQILGEGMVNEMGNGNHSVVGDRIWFPTSAGRVFYSYDRGLTWAVSEPELNGPLPNNVISISMRDSDHGLLISNQPNEIFRTEDGGVTWEDMDIVDYEDPIYQIAYVPGTQGTYVINNGWANGEPFARVTLDEGDNWEFIDTEETVSCMEFLSPTVGYGGGYVYAADDGGIFRWDDPSLLVTSIDEDIITTFSVYPNPVKDELNIQFSNIESIQSIQVFDVMGKLVLEKNSLGHSRIEKLNFSTFPSGTYSIQVITENGSSSDLFVKY